MNILKTITVAITALVGVMLIDTAGNYKELQREYNKSNSELLRYKFDLSHGRIPDNHTITCREKKGYQKVDVVHDTKNAEWLITPPEQVTIGCFIEKKSVLYR